MSATVTHRPERRKKPWRVSVSKPGEPRRYYHFTTEREARGKAQALNDLQRATEGWLDTRQEIVFTRDALTGWIENYRPSLSKSYEKTARGLVDRHLIPHFGMIPLAEITTAHMLAFVEKVYVGGQSGALALNALSILRRVCQLHVEMGLLDRNPCARVGSLVQQVAGRHETHIQRAAAWTREEAGTLLELALRHEKHLYPMLVCGLHTGLRRSELIGLEWPAVGPRAITVDRARVRGEGKVPKSRKIREVPISDTLQAVLAELRSKVAKRDAFRELGPVFQPAQGGYWDEANVGRAYRRLMVKAVAAGVRPLRFHDLRHTFASWALESGLSIKWVQERLGHSSAELTLRTYSHLMPGSDDEMGFLDGPAVRLVEADEQRNGGE